MRNDTNLYRREIQNAIVSALRWRYVETELPEHARRLIEYYAFVGDNGELRRLSGELGEELARQLEASTP